MKRRAWGPRKRGYGAIVLGSIKQPLEISQAKEKILLFMPSSLFARCILTFNLIKRMEKENKR